MCMARSPMRPISAAAYRADTTMRRSVAPVIGVRGARTPVLGGGAEVVDAGVLGDDPLRPRQIGAQQGTGGRVEGLGYQTAHAGQTPTEVVELLLVGVAHEVRVAPFRSR